MLLQLNNLSKGYGDPLKSNFRLVLDGLNLEIAENQKIAIAGQSGSGKTTLLNLMGTLDLPDSGEIWFKGKSLNGFSEKELAQFRNSQLGFVFQMHYLLPQLTLWENVLIPLLPLKKSIGRIEKEWAEHLLKKVGIWDRRFQRPAELSGGESQRTAVVRALINKPQLILADEPTGALDEENAGYLAELLNHIGSEEGVSIVIVTHSSELASQMDHVFHLKNGKLL